MNVLVVEDTSHVVNLVKFCLKEIWSDAEVLSTSSGKEGVQLARSESPEFAILDLGLPDIEGFEVLKRIRLFSNVPIIILTARDSENDKIKGLEMGADDYVVKPFSPGELVARIRAVIRRTQIPVPQVNTASSIKGKLEIDYDTRQVTVEGKQIKLAPSAYQVLCLLASSKGQFVSNEILLKTLTGKTYVQQANYVEVFISYLRNTLEENPKTPTMIIGDPEVGYKLA
ncbi:response regulator transcription factor [Chloroflexota bacterium]